MIYIDSNFRFYDDSKDLETFPELKPTPDAVPLTDDQVKEITADITKWRWHPVENKPYKLPDCDTKYWKTVDGVILEMDEAEKAAVDQAEQAAAETVALAQAAFEANIVAKATAVESNIPSWTQVSTAVDNISNLAEAKAFLKKLSRVVYWLAKNSEE